MRVSGGGGPFSGEARVDVPVVVVVVVEEVSGFVDGGEGAYTILRLSEITAT